MAAVIAFLSSRSEATTFTRTPEILLMRHSFQVTRPNADAILTSVIQL
jgi:hypothetical protein